MKLRTLMAIVTALCVFLGLGIGLYRQVAGPVISDSTLDLLYPGMSMAEVENVLGTPSARNPSDTKRYPTSETWIYERAANPGWVEVFFDHDRKLDSVNDESVFSRHQRRPDSPPLP